MRSKHPASAPSPLPNVHVTNYGRINSPGDDIRVDMAKEKRQPAGCSNAGSGASCDEEEGNEDTGDEDHGDEDEEDWPENGHDDSASGDEVPAGGIDDDNWWMQPIGSGDDVEEWHAGDDDDDGGADAVADAAADATVEAQAAGANTAAVVVAEAGDGRDAVFFEGEDDADDPWRVSSDDDVPLLKRRLRHSLGVSRKKTRVLLSDDDSPDEERRPRVPAADKGKAKVVEVPAKVAPRVGQSKKKWKDDGDPGSSKGAKRQKKKVVKNKDDILANEAQGSDDDYAEAAGPMPSFPEKAKPKDPTIWNLRRPPHPVVLQWIAEAWDQVPRQVIIDAFRHCGISSKLDGTENHLVMSHLRARSTTDVTEDMCLGGTTGDNTRLLGKAPEEEEEEEMQAEGVKEVAVATGLEVLYQETPHYRGAAAEADRMIEPVQTARHAWRVPDLGMQEPPSTSADEEGVTEGG
ncbi:unnamed protein product [Closterium sp. NIES-65]|nr:unnamed protein product [Closterium sp. NIES-65]